jgi:DNA-binding transcriptional MerR regulator
MPPAPLKVGELARQTGLSVRTLHHYDALGLLAPSARTAAGHRLYAAADVARLQQVQSLKQLGFSLEEIRDCLDRPEFAPGRVVERHLARLREQIELQQRLCRRLEALAERFRAAGEIPVAEFLQTIEVMTMLEKYYTPEQLEWLRQRGEQLGEERIRQVEAEWPELMAQVRAEMEKGTDPASESVQRLARRWRELVREFTGGNPGIEQSLSALYRQEPTVAGLDTQGMRPLMEYVSKALAAKRVG